MALIRIVTDSTADIPASTRHDLAIEMVPLQVIFGQESFEDQVTLGVSAFYEKLQNTSITPTTSQPSPARFLETYERILAETPDATILSLHLSSALSGTYQSAMIARSMLDDHLQEKVIVIDTKTASLGFGFVVVEVAKAAQKGQSVAACLQLIETLLRNKKMYFIVDTLTYLHKGGRIGGASAFVGSLLQVKPILSVSEEGTVYSVDKARGTNRAIIKIMEIITKDFNDQSIHLVIGHANAQKQAEEMANLIASQFDVIDTNYTEIGPVIGTHSGPGALAVVVYPS
jgi:DegV family protein with EDD domain